MNSTTIDSDSTVLVTPSAKVVLSRWINEPLPPFQELLSARDVARLTRRSKLVISGLVLLRRFPKKRRFRGRKVGWLRAEVLDWMSRDLKADESCPKSAPVPRRCASASPQQPCLPLECAFSCPQALPRSVCTLRRRPRSAP